MPYDPSTQPHIWLPSDNLGATILNREISDPLRYLLNERQLKIIQSEALAYTTGSTTFIDVDATNLILSVTVKSTKAIVWANFSWQAQIGSLGAAADITYNGTRLGNTTGGLARIPDNSQQQRCILGPYILNNVPAGTHVFKMQFKSFTATAIALGQNYPLIFAAAEAW